MAELVFWFSLLMILYTGLGYPMVLLVLSLFVRKEVDKKEFYPEVTLLIPAFNEEDVIEEKILNSLSLDYPKEKLEIIVASDGSTDGTSGIVKRYLSEGITFHDYPVREGKTMLLNKTVPQASGDIIVFSDTSSIIDTEGFKELIFNFHDKKVGSACGKYKLGFDATTARDGGEGVYWKYETFLKEKESAIGSTLGAHGAFYAIRKRLFAPLKKDLINDDFAIPAGIVLQDFRAVYDPAAVAHEMTRTSSQGEMKRRQRIMVGNLQQVFELKSLLTAGVVPCWQFLSHKVLRIFLPLFFSGVFVSNLFLHSTFYRVMLGSQVAFYVLGLLGSASRNNDGLRVLTTLPYYVILLNVSTIMGTVGFLTKGAKVTWHKVQ